MPDHPAETVTKLDAARRQLATAIELWFHDKDQVSIHTLAFASHEIIDALSRKNGRTKELLYDTILVKEEDRRKFRDALSHNANFFKHGSKDPYASTTLVLFGSEMFMMFSIMGLEDMKIKKNGHEVAFLSWFIVSRNNLLTVSGREFIEERMPVEQLNQLSGLNKLQFFEESLKAFSDLKAKTIN